MENSIDNKLEVVLAGLLKQETNETRKIRLKGMVGKPVLTNSDFMQLFSISPRSSHRWRNDQGIPHFKISGRVYYLWTALLPLLEAKLVA